MCCVVLSARLSTAGAVQLGCRSMRRKMCLGTVTNIIGTFVFRQESVCTDVLGSGNVFLLLLIGEFR